jgi:hypothetical protein
LRPGCRPISHDTHTRAPSRRSAAPAASSITDRFLPLWTWRSSFRPLARGSGAHARAPSAGPIGPMGGRLGDHLSASNPPATSHGTLFAPCRLSPDRLHPHHRHRAGHLSCVLDSKSALMTKIMSTRSAPAGVTGAARAFRFVAFSVTTPVPERSRFLLCTYVYSSYAIQQVLSLIDHSEAARTRRPCEQPHTGLASCRSSPTVYARASTVLVRDMAQLHLVWLTMRVSACRGWRSSPARVCAARSMCPSYGLPVWRRVGGRAPPEHTRGSAEHPALSTQSLAGPSDPPRPRGVMIAMLNQPRNIPRTPAKTAGSIVIRGTSG